MFKPMLQLCSKNRLSRRAFVKAASGLFVPTLLLPKAAAQALTLNDPVLGVTSTAAAVSNGLLTNLTAYWKMDEAGASGSRADATGNGWTAADTNANVAAASGLINNGINISTSTKGLTVSSSMDARGQTSAFSFSFWLKPSVSFSNNFGLCAFYGGTTWGWYITENGAGALNYATLDNAGNETDLGINGMVIGTWQHIVCGYDGASTIHLYRNTLHQSVTLTAPQAGVTRGSNGLIIGNNQILSAGQTGIVDECAYYKRLITQTDVNTIYNSGNGLAFSQYS